MANNACSKPHKGSGSRKCGSVKRLVRLERCELRTGSGVEELWRKVTPLELSKRSQLAAKRKIAYSPVRIDRRTDRFYGEVDRRLRKGGL